MQIFSLTTIERHLKVEGPTMLLVGTWNEPKFDKEDQNTMDWNTLVFAIARAKM